MIDQLTDLGTRMVQFIGGKPTLHRGLPVLIGHALDRGVEVEVFTNLMHVSPNLWEVLSQLGVRLATSYYSDDAEQHERITRGQRSYEWTWSNLVEAVRRSVPVRVGVIDIEDGQRAQEAVSQLRSLGVEGEVRVDRLRQVGRCGRTCLPMVAGGQRKEESLVDILTGPRMTQTASLLATEFARRPLNPCVPNMCDPQCGPSCSPACRPAGNCTPTGACAPDYH
ncbi:radical SAM protein [Lentzea jiangxiensis]|uniref:Radical SAM core domain-containing protein n=1 Tax=Lentzea jiangxiensis TaxID=641025 RepID=A0A1H0WTC8_9PSEU|nr:radical SAM protein [Lentzea jiangxiensis]SDP94024.1 hypothetical protein SAMN05421507_12311 [Lentzea jiangxiensis]